jgi:sugar O-acyltransferase (sialic acid O-acetyltransferase NeuD family)
MTGDLIIVGAGGFGREVYQYARDCWPGIGLIVKGFLDDNLEALGEQRLPQTVVARVDEYAVQPADCFAIAVGNPQSRRALVERLRNSGARFVSIVHPLAYVAPTASLGEGCILAPFAFVGPDSDVGAFSVLNTYASCGHDAKTGAYSVLSPYAVLNGNVELGDEVFLGTHATVIPGKKVGARSKLAAGCVVFKDVPERSLATGNPASSRQIYR